MAGAGRPPGAGGAQEMRSQVLAMMARMPRSSGTRQAGVVVYRSTGEVDAIDQYARLLTAALVGRGAPARYVSGGLPLDARQWRSAPWMLVQYCPFSYGRWGFAPRLVAGAASVRGRSQVRLGIVVHEGWVSSRGWRNGAMGAYQRTQLHRLVDLAHVVIVTTEELAGRLGERAVHVPVASNIAPVDCSREAARRQLGYGEELVVAMFGTPHPSRAIDHGVAAIKALADERDPSALRVLNLGADAPGLGLSLDVNVDTPGVLGDRDLSMRLRACDMLLLPFNEGVSTRRTTLMAGLAHGVPVVGSRGPHTDRSLLEHEDALVLAPAHAAGAYAVAAVALAADAVRRRQVAAAGQRLYDTTFDWPILAGRVEAAMQIAAP